jgi:hypothetical protein
MARDILAEVKAHRLSAGRTASLEPEFADALIRECEHVRKVLDCIGHSRTSCTDEASNGNEYPNETGLARCARCALLRVLNNDPCYGRRLVLSVEARWVGDHPAEEITL